MTYRKLQEKMFVGMLAFAIVASGAAMSASSARADNDHNEGTFQSNDSHKQEKDAKLVGSSLEVHITNGGNVLVRGAKVTAISGNTITASTMWGSVAMSWTVNTDSSTKLLRRYGGASTISEIAVGDFISFQGSLVTGTASPVTVLAKTVRDYSVQKKNATFEGSVSSISGTSFVLASSGHGNITINTATPTIITKNGATGVFADIAVGAKASATGLYNNLNSTLEASKVNVKVAVPQAMTKEGTVKSIPGTTAPTTFVMTSGGNDYTVNIATTTSVLKNNWTTASLANFAIGNQVRVYGIVNTNNTIDATVVRNVNL